MGSPSVTSSATPSRAVYMPRVATNGCIFPLVMMKPFKNPIPVLTAIPNRTARSGGTERLVAATAITEPESAISEPTERSIPPVIITNVMPIAMIPSTADWLRMLRKFFPLKKIFAADAHNNDDSQQNYNCAEFLQDITCRLLF